MSTPLATVLLIAGITLLAWGADVLVRGAVTLAKAARVSTAVIGLTIVAMGTSLPELTVSVAAALRGTPDIALGNVIGSNIFNIGIVLGVTALVQPIRVHGGAVRLEWPFMFVASFQLLLLARDGHIDRLEGEFFLVALALFTAYAVHVGRQAVNLEEASNLADEVRRKTPPAPLGSLGGAAVLVTVGIVLLIVGGEIMLRGAVALAHAAGMTDRVIGLTVVAMGTSAPELATSVMAARRGQSELALANVIGSNIFNVLGILGVTAVLTPMAVAAELIRSDLWWMLGLSLALLPMMRTRAVVSRLEGLVLVVAYGTYLTLLTLGR